MRLSLTSLPRNVLRRLKPGSSSAGLYDACNKRLGAQQMNYHFSISLKNRYFYCEVAKAGCSAVKSELWRQELSDVPMPPGYADKPRNTHAAFPQHVLIKPYQLGREGFETFLSDPKVMKWIVVRNPFTRALSGYLDKIRRDAPQFAANIAPLVAMQRGVPATEVAADSVTFEEFCEALATFKTARSFDQHWRPQYRHTCADLIDYSDILKLETLAEDSQRLSRHMGRPVAFTRGRGHATGSSDKIAAFYTPRAADLIRQVYAEDFAQFGYPLDLPV